MIDKTLLQSDPEVATAVEGETSREKGTLVMIASENYASCAVMAAQASVMTNKYAEGYPDKRYYGGCEYVDVVERLAVERAKRIFRAAYANVQPHSGSQANMAVYLSFLRPGDKIMGMDLSHGGHLTHGSPVNFSGILFQTIFYGLDKKDQRLDYQRIHDMARQHRPKLIIAGASAYPRIIDFHRFAEIAQDTGAYLMVDMAHIAGLVAADLHPSPVGQADFVTSTTHKTLRGPRGGLILSRDEYGRRLDKGVFPCVQGGPLMHVIAAKAVSFREALQEDFRIYQRRVVMNARILAERLSEDGFDLVTGGTDNHLVLIDLRSKGITGLDAERALGEAGIAVNKNTIPFDDKGPIVTSGIRIGTPALTTRGMRESEMEMIAELIKRVIHKPGDEKILRETRSTVADLCARFPVYNDLSG